MLDETPNRDLIERAEDLILRLRDVRSARIYADEEGKIAEIHVVAATERAPKLIARDVETVLKAGLGVSIDYRKIGVVVMEPRRKEPEEDATPAAPAQAPETPHQDAAADEPVDLRELIDESAKTPETEAEAPGTGPALEFLEEDARVRYRSIRATIEGDRIEVEVKLEKSGLVVTGVGSDVRRGESPAEAAATAALEAIADILDEEFRLRLDGVEELPLDGRMAICVGVSAVRGREATHYVGSVLAGDDRNESTVLAVLDALNRPLGRWKLRREIHYRIS